MGSGRTASCFPVLCVVRRTVHRWDGWRVEGSEACTNLACFVRQEIISSAVPARLLSYESLQSVPATNILLFAESLVITGRSLSPPSLSLSLCLHPGSLSVGLLGQCQTIHGRDRNCTPLQLPPEWITTLLFIVLGIISLTVTCGLMAISRCHCEASRYARWIAFAGSTCSHSNLHSQGTLICQHVKSLSRKEK